MTEFWSWFQFQILLKFYWTAYKMIKKKLEVVMLKSFGKYHHLFNLHIFCYYFAFYD